MAKTKKNDRKSAKVLIAIVICFIIILGGGYGTLSILKSIALKTDHFGTPSTEVFSENEEISEDSFVTLYKQKNKDFVILNITDTHMSDYDYRLFTGYFARRDIEKLVKEIKPDLITMSGDLICADSEYNSVHKLTEFMNSLKTPWAPIFGNHDGEAENIDKDYLAEVMIGKEGDKNNYCVMKKGPGNLGGEDDSHGHRVGNYVINIVEEETGDLAQSLIMMDTGRDQLTDTQILWYKKNMDKIHDMYGDDAKSTLIVHIPLAEYYYAYMEGYNPSTKEWRVDYKTLGAYGDCFEDVCCDKKKFKSLTEMVKSDEYKALPQKYRTVEYQNYFLKNGVPVKEGIFKYLKENGTLNVLCGHDHLNCFLAPYEGVNLIYSLKNGMGSGYKVGRNGGTVLTLSGSTITASHYYL